jgi:hypothetical protein
MQTAFEYSSFLLLFRNSKTVYIRIADGEDDATKESWLNFYVNVKAKKRLCEQSVIKIGEKPSHKKSACW